MGSQKIGNGTQGEKGGGGGHIRKRLVSISMSLGGIGDERTGTLYLSNRGTQTEGSPARDYVGKKFRHRRAVAREMGKQELKERKGLTAKGMGEGKINTGRSGRTVRKKEGKVEWG